MKRVNKKAALEMSVNSIITIIIAVLVLGFILSFLSGAWQKVTTSIESKLSEEPEAPVATITNPIQISRSPLVVNSGENAVLKFSVFNVDDGQQTVAPNIECKDATGTTTLAVIPHFNSKLIDTKKTEKFEGYVEIPDVAASTYLCTITLDGWAGTTIFTSPARDLVITVR